MIALIAAGLILLAMVCALAWIIGLVRTWTHLIIFIAAFLALPAIAGILTWLILVNKERPRPLEHHAPADGAFLFPLASHIPGWEVISATGRERIDDAAVIASRSAR